MGSALEASAFFELATGARQPRWRSPGPGQPPGSLSAIVVYHYSLYDVKGIMVYSRSQVFEPPGGLEFVQLSTAWLVYRKPPRRDRASPPYSGGEPLGRRRRQQSSPPQMRRGGALGDGVVLNRKGRNSRPQGGEIAKPRLAGVEPRLLGSAMFFA